MKPPLLLLHGPIGAGRQMKEIAAKLSDAFDVHYPDLPGHGGHPLPEEPFSIQLFANSVLSYLNAKQLHQLTIFGYSLGGYVAMYLAKLYPRRITRIITLGTKFYWDTYAAEKAVRMMDPVAVAFKVNIRAERLAILHAPYDWQHIMLRTANMIMEIGKNNPLKADDFKGIYTPAMIMLGDRDNMVTFNETMRIYQQLPLATLAILPCTSHAIELLNAEMAAFLIRRFAAPEHIHPLQYRGFY